MDENGFKLYGGGITPLWSGDYKELKTNTSNGKYPPAITIDVIEYNKDIQKYIGFKYGVRLKYGSYNYVEEEF